MSGFFAKILEKLLSSLVSFLLDWVQSYIEKGQLEDKIKEANQNPDRRQASQDLNDMMR